MNFWQAVSFTETEQLIDIGKHCEEVGFHGIAFAEHLVTPENIGSTYPYTPDGNVWWDPAAHWPDVWAMATAVSTHTTTLHFTSTIYILPLHDPVTAAKAISTAAYVSGGRVINGIAVGWMKEEFLMTGQDFHTRGKRTDEMLEVLEKLISGKMVEHHGQYYDFPPVQMSPAPAERVPVWCGGDSEAAIARAARNDGWIAGGPHPYEVVVDQISRLRKALDGQGRTLDGYRVMASVAAEPDVDLYRRLADAGVTDMVRPPAYYTGTPTSTIEWKRDEISRYAEQIIAPING